jgi:hypothetical protein
MFGECRRETLPRHSTRPLNAKVCLSSMNSLLGAETRAGIPILGQDSTRRRRRAQVEMEEL